MIELIRQETDKMNTLAEQLNEESDAIESFLTQLPVELGELAHTLQAAVEVQAVATPKLVVEAISQDSPSRKIVQDSLDMSQVDVIPRKLNDILECITFP